MKKLFPCLILTLFTHSVFALFPKEVESKILYLTHKGEVTQAFTCYLQEAKKYEHNYKLLQDAALSLLEEGIKNSEMQVRLLSLLGAGVALHKTTLPILKQALRSDQPELQLASLHFLARFEEDEAITLLEEALSSSLLLVRLEAALILAEKQNPKVIDLLSSFYGKIPVIAQALFPQILVEIDTEASTKFLKQLLSETDARIRVATIVHAGIAKRDDLLESIRTLSTHPDYMEAEAAAFALGKLGDSESQGQLWKLTKRNNSEVKLAALQALLELGYKEAMPPIFQEAEQKNLFAVALLGACSDYPEAVTLLHKLREDSDFDMQINANLSLLKLKDKSALSFFQKLLIEDTRDCGFISCQTPGKALSYWKNISSYSQKMEKDPRLEAENTKFRVQIITNALELPEDDFLYFAKKFFEKE